MTNIYVFDPSALIALFRGNEKAFDLMREADAGQLQLIFPAVAVAEANSFIQASESAWEPVLMGRIECTPLTAHVAITVGPWPGDLAVRHVVYESRAVRCDIATLEPDRYRPWSVPLLLL